MKITIGTNKMQGSKHLQVSKIKLPVQYENRLMPLIICIYFRPIYFSLTIELTVAAGIREKPTLTITQINRTFADPALISTF